MFASPIVGGRTCAEARARASSAAFTRRASSIAGHHLCDQRDDEGRDGQVDPSLNADCAGSLLASEGHEDGHDRGDDRSIPGGASARTSADTGRTSHHAVSARARAGGRQLGAHRPPTQVDDDVDGVEQQLAFRPAK